MKIKTKDIFHIITFLLIILSLFMTKNVLNNNTVLMIYLLINFVLIIMNLYTKKINKKVFILFSLVALIILIAFLIGNNGIVNMFITFSFLLVLYIQFCVLDYPNIAKSNKILLFFYYICFASILIHTAYNVIHIKEHSFSPFFISSFDKNYASIIIFLFICLSVKLKKKNGVLIGLLLATLFYSRLFLIGIIGLAFLWGVERMKKAYRIHLNHPAKIFGLIAIMTIATVLFSYFMTFCVPVKSITKYRQSFNDDSNAIRVRANVYAIETVKKNWKFIFSGYDNSIRQEIGAKGIWDSKQYLGFRLVQPHNFLLNFFLRYGVMITIIYLAIFSKLLSKFYNKENLKYIIPYLFMNMFMHSLLSNIYLLFFIYILNIDEKTTGDLHEKE